MSTTILEDMPARSEVARARDLFERQLRAGYERADRLFLVLLLIQWAAAVVTALLISPTAWAGTAERVHIHVWAALLLGGAIAALPVLLRLGQARLDRDASRHRGRPDAHGRPAHPPERRPDRGAFPRLRLARLPGALSRLAGAGDRDDRRGPGSFPPERLLASLHLRRPDDEPLAMARARRLGPLRGRRPRLRLRRFGARTAPARRPPGGGRGVAGADRARQFHLAG